MAELAMFFCVFIISLGTITLATAIKRRRDIDHYTKFGGTMEQGHRRRYDYEGD